MRLCSINALLSYKVQLKVNGAPFEVPQTLRQCAAEGPILTAPIPPCKGQKQKEEKEHHPVIQLSR
jgi:hypothetical protein